MMYLSKRFHHKNNVDIVNYTQIDKFLLLYWILNEKEVA